MGEGGWVRVVRAIGVCGCVGVGGGGGGVRVWPVEAAGGLATITDCHSSGCRVPEALRTTDHGPMALGGVPGVWSGYCKVLPPFVFFFFFLLTTLCTL